MKKSRNRDREFNNAVEVLEEWDELDEEYLASLEREDRGGYIEEDQVSLNTFKKEKPAPIKHYRYNPETDEWDEVETRPMTAAELLAYVKAAEQEESDG